jgi:hypothetical protein
LVYTTVVTIPVLLELLVSQALEAGLRLQKPLLSGNVSR